jgi:hypothetical protein
VDLGAIFRLAPGLITAAGANGTVEFVVTGPERRDVYTFKLSEDGATVEERSADSAGARVTGAPEAWVKAFSPERDRKGLEFSGDGPLAEALLNGLAAVGRRAATSAAEAA